MEHIPHAHGPFGGVPTLPFVFLHFPLQHPGNLQMMEQLSPPKDNINNSNIQ
jgi:hypothetical protein